VGFRGPAGTPSGIGHAFNITSDEVLTWGRDLSPDRRGRRRRGAIVHIASDFIAACLPEWSGTLLGDKSGSAVFDTTKIKRFVPDFRPWTPYAEGIRRTVALVRRRPARQLIDAEMDARWDRLIAAYEQGLANAVAGVRLRSSQSGALPHRTAA